MKKCSYSGTANIFIISIKIFKGIFLRNELCLFEIAGLDRDVEEQFDELREEELSKKY